MGSIFCCSLIGTFVHSGAVIRFCRQATHAIVWQTKQLPMLIVLLSDLRVVAREDWWTDGRQKSNNVIQRDLRATNVVGHYRAVIISCSKIHQVVDFLVFYESASHSYWCGRSGLTYLILWSSINLCSLFHLSDCSSRWYADDFHVFPLQNRHLSLALAAARLTCSFPDAVKARKESNESEQMKHTRCTHVKIPSLRLMNWS